MQKLRNKKKLTMLVTAFMLTLIVGSAFAFGPGQLGIAGFIGVYADLEIVWDSAVPSADTAAVTTNQAFIVAGTRPGQGINWAIGFNYDEATGPVSATLVATALNEGGVPANIIGLDFHYAPGPGFTAVVANSAAIFPVHLAPGATFDFTVTVTWDGTTMPPAFTSTLDIPEVDALLEDYGFLTHFAILFDYVPGPPLP